MTSWNAKCPDVNDEHRHCWQCFGDLKQLGNKTVISRLLGDSRTIFSLLRLECPPILTSGEMLSHPGRWDKPIPEVIHLWRHRTSTPNNLEKSRLGCVLNIFCTFLGKNEKNNQTPHWGRDFGIPSSCLRFGKPRRGLQILDTRKGFPRPSLNAVFDYFSHSCVVLDSISPSVVEKIRKTVALGLWQMHLGNSCLRPLVLTVSQIFSTASGQ